MAYADFRARAAPARKILRAKCRDRGWTGLDLRHTAVFQRAEGVLQHSEKPLPEQRTASPRRGGAALVALGILCSRLAGLIRQRVFAHYFGQESAAADAFNAAFRIPNLLQNLFGEGSLSASFIPVYAKLLAEGRREEAGRVAGTPRGAWGTGKP